VKEEILNDITGLLKKLIATPSFSREETDAAAVVRTFLNEKSIPFETRMHNTWAYNLHFDEAKPTLLLNSHIDTVKPSAIYTRNPFSPDTEDGKLFGLGSNDAGGALVCLLGAFLYFYEEQHLPFNLCFAATAEEEISGHNGIALIQDITHICAAAIIGEPTEMKMAIAERGLMVLDAEVKGVAGHAARDTGVNAIYQALDDLNWFSSKPSFRECPVLGPTKMTVTVIEAGKQHNVIPDTCRYVVDVRTTAAYSYDELLNWMQSHLKADIVPRSTRLKPSIISEDHPLVATARKMGIDTFGSATLSDQALLHIPSVKIGPGKSERSHTADEFIYLDELQKGLDIYIELIKTLPCLLNPD
jgi:acetylornithine deacetylase